MLEEIHPPPPEHKPNSFVCMLCVMYESMTLRRLSTAFQTDRPELVNRCCLEQLRMRTWGVSTKPDQRGAATATSHPCNMIYVTVSENFMTALLCLLQKQQTK